MKKSLLMSLAITVAMTASAQWQMSPVQTERAPQSAAPANAQGAKWFTYCEGPAEGIGAGQVCAIGGAMLIPTGNPQNNSDFTITKVGVAVGNPCSATTATLFITSGLNKAPIYTQEFTPAEPNQWLDIELDTPFQLTHSPVYIGYYLAAAASDYPVGFDNVPTSNTNGGYIGYSQNSAASYETFSWENVASQFGSVAVRAWIEGVYPDLAASADALTAPSSVGVDSPFDVSFVLTNDGTDPITSVGYSYAFGTEEATSVTKEFENAIPFGTSETISFPCQLPQTGQYTMTLTVNTINGQAVEIAPLTASLEASSCTTPRMMVIEENTCVGCGYCVYGIVGVEYVTHKYPGKVAAIVVHNTGQSADAMAVSSYSGMPTGGGNPSSFVNRESKFNGNGGSVYPDMNTLEDIYLSDFNGTVGSADVFIESAEWTDGTMTALNLKSKANFGADYDKAKYRWVHVMLEDNVGPYNQKNYLAGTNPGAAGGEWGSYPQSYSWYFNDVYRWSNGYGGVVNSIPAVITVGEDYEYEQLIPLTGIKNTANADIVIKPEDTRFLAMVVNSGTPKSILNAAMISAADVTFPEGVADQTVTFDEIPEEAEVNETVELSATASSGEPITYMIQCPNGIATLTDNVLSLKKAGLVKVHAIQAGSENLKRAVATQEIVVNKKAQTITWDQEFEDIQLNTYVTLQATASSGLNVTYKILTPGSGARISNGKLLFSKDATIEVQASQSGNNTWAAADPVIREITCSTSGIEGVTVDNDANARYYNLQGVEVMNPQEGQIYIKVANGKSAKIVK